MSAFHIENLQKLAIKVSAAVSQKRVHISLCVHLNGHFPDGSGLAGTRTSPFWILLERRMMKVVVTTGAIRCAKLQLNRHQQQINTHKRVHP